jgi:trigger factor
MSIIELNDISDVRKSIEVEVPADVVSAEITAIAREFARRARIPGFRPGKAPLGLIKTHYRDDILSEAYQHLLPRYFSDAAREKELDLVDSPIFEKVDYTSGEPLRFTAVFEVYPEVNVENYTGIPVEDIQSTIDDNEVDKYLESLREERAEMVPVDDERPVAAGDFAEISFTGSFDGPASPAEDAAEGPDAEAPAPPEGFIREKALCEIGGENTVREFTENLTGAAPGEERTFVVAYRDDHPDQRLAGRSVRYAVEVEGIKKKVVPDLDDEFAASLGKYKTVADLRAEIAENMAKHRKQHADQQIRDSLLRWLEDHNAFEVPETLVERQLEVRLNRLVRNLAQQGMNPERLDIDWARIRSEQYDQAIRDVRGMLILDHIAEREDVSVADSEIDHEITSMAEEMKQPEAAVRETLRKNEAIGRMRDQIRHRKVMGMLQAQARMVPAGSLAPESVPAAGPSDSAITPETGTGAAG